MKLYFGGIEDDKSLRLIIRAEGDGVVGGAQIFVQPDQIVFGKTYNQILETLQQHGLIEISDQKPASQKRHPAVQVEIRA